MKIETLTDTHTIAIGMRKYQVLIVLRAIHAAVTTGVYIYLNVM